MVANPVRGVRFFLPGSSFLSSSSCFGYCPCSVSVLVLRMNVLGLTSGLNSWQKSPETGDALVGAGREIRRVSMGREEGFFFDGSGGGLGSCRGNRCLALWERR